MNTINLMDIWPVIAFIGVQTVVITWWAATTTSQLAVLKLNSDSSKNNGERLAKIETSLESIERMMSHFEDRLPQKRRGA